MMYNAKAITGKYGEDIACRWLRENGFMLRERNWRNGRYEIDVIAERYGVIHVIEVKTRQAGGMLLPEQTITPGKAAALKRAASAYLSMYRIRCEVEFDLLAIDTLPDHTYDIRFIQEIIE